MDASTFLATNDRTVGSSLAQSITGQASHTVSSAGVSVVVSAGPADHRPGPGSDSCDGSSNPDQSSVNRPLGQLVDSRHLDLLDPVAVGDGGVGAAPGRLGVGVRRWRVELDAHVFGVVRLTRVVAQRRHGNRPDAPRVGGHGQSGTGILVRQRVDAGPEPTDAQRRRLEMHQWDGEPVLNGVAATLLGSPEPIHLHQPEGAVAAG